MNNRVPPENYKNKRVYLAEFTDLDGKTILEVVDIIRSWDQADMVDQKLSVECYTDDDDDRYGWASVYMSGFVPLTEAEIAKEKLQKAKRLQTARENAKTRKTKEIEELKRLAKKYPNIVGE